MSTLFRVDMQIVPMHGHAEQRGHATPPLKTAKKSENAKLPQKSGKSLDMFGTTNYDTLSEL
ncbi:MAG: hypothetical protein WBD75_08500 [Phycisphaerae bacterium]